MTRSGSSLRAGAAKTARVLWHRRFHWPIVPLAGALAAAVVLPATVFSPLSVASRDPVTYSAGSWPGLLHRSTAGSVSSSSPADAVPACGDQGGASNQLTATLSGASRTARGPARAVFASLLAPTPVVTSVSPASGPASGGTSVVIEGSGFTGATAVLFGAVPSLSFSVVSDSEITATSPPGLGPENVTVVTLGGPSAASSTDQFTYTVPSLPTQPSVPGTPSAPGVGAGSGSPGSGKSGGAGSGGTGSSSSTGSGSSTATGTLPGIDGSLPSNTALTPPAITPPGSIPSYGYGFGDGTLGCGLIDSSTGAKAPGESAAQARAVQLALSFIGTPYVWGGESAQGFDCSGLVQFVYSAAGVSLPRTAQEQYDAGPAVPPGDAVVPGDLVFFGTGPDGVSHVGIFVGNGVMVDAPHTGADVRLDQINGFEPIVGVTSPGQ